MTVELAEYKPNGLYLVIDGHRVTTGEKYTIIEMGYVVLMAEDGEGEQWLKNVTETIPRDREGGRNALSGVTSDPVIVALAYGHWWARNSDKEMPLGAVRVPSREEAIEIVRNRRILNGFNRKYQGKLPHEWNDENQWRREAAERYKPTHVRLLLVAQTPPLHRPPDSPRYFYFEDVVKHDHLFRGVVKAVLNEEPDRHQKSALLSQLRDKGVFLIDLKPDPTDPRPLKAFVPDLLERCKQLQPGSIILIKSDVYDAAFEPLRKAGYPVIDVWIPFPSSGRQKEFADKMAEALGKMNWTA